jgi:hypothetical protein
MSFILTLKDMPEGVFSVVDKDTGDHVIPIFDDRDDCERYAEQLSSSESQLDLQMIQIEKQLIVFACEQREQRYAIITIDDFIIPPDDLT